MDPLQRLRDFYTENRLDEVKLVDGRVSFGRGEYEFSGDVKTNFLSSINKQPYTLAQLLLYIQNWDKQPNEYAKLALKAHIQNVYIADMQKLKAFLRREQELDNLDEGPLKRPLEEGEEDDEPPFKKQAPKPLCRIDIERNLRSRENLLVLPHKDFSNCIQLFAEAEKKYTDKRKHQEDKAKIAAQSKSSRMDRNASQSTTQQQKLDVKIYGDGAGPGMNSQKKKASLQPTVPSRHSAGSKSSHSAPQQQLKPPIIIVPESESALVSQYNAKELLQDGEFVPLEHTAMVKSGEKKPDILHIKRRLPSGQSIRFEIRDKVPSNGSKNWERVVAVVCSGKLWQFKKGYPFLGASDGDLLETFHNLCGFYFHYGGDDVSETVKSWNVKQLSLNRSQRHGDVQTVQMFFDHLITWLDSKKRDGKNRRAQLCRPEKLHYK